MNAVKNDDGSPQLETLDFTSLEEHSIFTFLSEIALGLSCQVFLVGGAVREYVWTGQLAHDLDFCIVDGEALNFARMFADATGGRLVPLDEENGIYRVVLQFNQAVSAESLEKALVPEAITFDFSDALGNNLAQDLARRDLTINAMAWDIVSHQFHDPHGGQKDLAQGRIRMIDPKNFAEDPLRMVRVFRFAAQLVAQEVDSATLQAISDNLEGLQQVAGERIQYELFRFLDTPVCYPYLLAMGECGLLEAIFPELEALREVPPNEHHHLWLYDHTLELVNQFEQELSRFPEPVQAHLLQPVSPACRRIALIKIACLLHDIGKPDTMMEYDVSAGAKRSVTFHGHDVMSEEMTDAIAQRLKWSTTVETYVKRLVRWHLYPAQFGLNSPRKSILKLFRRLGDETLDVLALSLADRLSTKGPAITEDIMLNAYENHMGLMLQYLAELENLRQPPLVNGHEIMDRFNLAPGPHLGRALDALIEVQQLGEVQTGPDALEWLAHHKDEWLPESTGLPKST